MNLSPQQIENLEKGEPVRILIGATPCVLVREDVYEEEADYSPWTVEEMNLLADEANEIISRSETDD